MKGLSKNIYVQLFCIKIAMLIAIVLLVVLTSCNNGRKYVECDAYGQVNSIHTQQKTAK